MEPLDVYVLGAGASYVHGAPLTMDILPYILANAAPQDAPRLAVVKALLKDVFHYDVDHAADAGADFPSLVDVLSVVDIALDRGENLAWAYDRDRLLQARAALEYALFRSLEHALSYQTKHQRRRSQATRDLVRGLDPARSVVLSLNYDVIIDIALAHRHQADFSLDAVNAEQLSQEKAQTVGIDYGVDFANMPPAGAGRFRLYKLHGSFNWLWSKVTGNLYFGGLSKAIAQIFDEETERVLSIDSYYARVGETPFAEAQRDLAPILVTPTHLKDMRNPYLAGLWRRAEAALRQARRVTFIGYSLPPDDIHIKYLLKRALETSDQANTWQGRPEIVVVDYSTLPEGERTPVEENYRRFLGDVRYYRDGFERYVQEAFQPLGDG